MLSDRPDLQYEHRGPGLLESDELPHQNAGVPRSIRDASWSFFEYLLSLFKGKLEKLFRQFQCLWIFLNLWHFGPSPPNDCGRLPIRNPNISLFLSTLLFHLLTSDLLFQCHHPRSFSRFGLPLLFLPAQALLHQKKDHQNRGFQLDFSRLRRFSGDNF